MHTDQALSILGLQRGATAEQIKAAYRAKSKEWHPDKAKATVREAHEQKMKEINAAYTFLEKNGSGGSHEPFWNDSHTHKEESGEWKSRKYYHGFGPGWAGFNGDAIRKNWEDMMRRQEERMKKAREEFRKYEWKYSHTEPEFTKHMCQHCGGTGYVHREKDTRGEPNF